MKILVASDIHGSHLYCKQLVEAFEREKANKLLLLGDLFYHGPRNALPEIYQPMQVAEMLNALRDRILCVRGNCDAEIDQMIAQFPIMADYCMLFIGGRTIFATHGHLYNTDQLPPLSPGDILLHGHTHVPVCESFGENNYYLNPGSVSIPKGGSERGYLLMDQTGCSWKTLDGAQFMRYDF